MLPKPKGKWPRIALSHTALRSLLARTLPVWCLALGVQLFWGIPALHGESEASTPVIVVSVDTLRADHLSCYGYDRLRTPNIDAFARGGTLFTDVNSQVPLTLPSHVSLFTSTFPFSNGVQENVDKLGPGLITLATILKAQGYSTAAFIGGFALDRQFGLDQGFDHYDSTFVLHFDHPLDLADLKRPGKEVTSAAMEWLGNHGKGPFFAFLHFYDLHTPYNLPPAERERLGGNDYDSELKYANECLGHFWAFLQKKGLVEKALIIFLSDHGEGLGEHGEKEHGYFVYQSTLRVALMIHWPLGARACAARVNKPVSLIDVSPTILQFLGLPSPRQFQGRSLLPLLHEESPAQEREVYSESLYAQRHLGTSPVRSLRVGRYKYIDTTTPELYDLSRDPHELSNLYSRQKSVALALNDQMLSLRSRFGTVKSVEAKALSPEVVERLNSLGYVAFTNLHPAGSGSAPDPKDTLAEYTKTQHAIELAQAGRLRESASLLESVLAKKPDLLESRSILGTVHEKLGQHELAVRDFREVLRKDSTNLLVHYDLAVSYFHLNQLDNAIKELEAVEAFGAAEGPASQQVTLPAGELLGTIWLQKKDYGRARMEFIHVLKATPRNYTAHYNLGMLDLREGKLDTGELHLLVAIQAEPNSSEAHLALGKLYFQRGDLGPAGDQFTEAARLDPKSASAHYNLGLVLDQKKMTVGAAREFRKALEVDPQFLAARQALRRIERSEE